MRSLLARTGLRLITENEAMIPESERGRYLACEVVDEPARSAMPAHPAGYLIVGVAGERTPDAGHLIGRLSDWDVGEDLRIRLRLNPFVPVQTEWWEADVELPLIWR